MQHGLRFMFKFWTPRISSAGASARDLESMREISESHPSLDEVVALLTSCSKLYSRVKHPNKERMWVSARVRKGEGEGDGKG